MKIRWLLLSAVILACSAQTPAATPTTAVTASPGAVLVTPFKSPRHLEYAFHVTYVQSGESHDSGMSEDGTGGAGSGVSADFGTGGREGTLAADVTAMTSDGGLVISLNEMIQSEPRPEERFTCIVYGDGRTSCPTAATHPSDLENLLLSFMGRGFVDPAKLDAKNHWQRAYSGHEIGVLSDFTVTETGDGKTVLVVEHSNVTSNVPSVGNTVLDAKITYNTALAVPMAMQSESHETFRGSSFETKMNVTLSKDSFATP
jgi:hypothetical protein